MIRNLLAAALCSTALATPSLASGRALSLSLSPSISTVTEGQSVSLMLGKSGGNGRVSAARVTASDGSFVANVLPGSAFTLPTKDDSVVQGPRTIILTALYLSTGATAQASVTILDNDVAPLPAPAPAPVPAPTPDPAAGPSIGPVGERTLDAPPGLANIPSTFDPSSLLIPAWGSGKIAGTDGDVVGAFRFICNFSQILRDDPIVYPGQPGKSHLHIFFGNTTANGNSTYASLRAAGDSTCEKHSLAGVALNRSAYWAPAMLDGHGSVVIPDLAAIYYKRLPISDPRCSLANANGEGNCAPLPNGLRYIFGYDMIGGVADLSNTWWNCVGQTAIPWNSSDPMQDHYPSLAYAATKCPTAVNPDGSHNQILQIIRAPNCWDGINLDSTNHRSHMAYEVNTGMGYFKCPADHPYMVPQFQLSIAYTVDANLGDWRLSSDAMHPELPAGSTSHSDWFGAWENGTMAEWMNNCINKRLTCSGGDLGDGKQIDGAYARPRTGPRLVPVP